MEEYRVSVANGLTIVEHLQHSLKMTVHRNRKVNKDTNTAHLEGLLYIEDGVFVKDGSYLFEVIDKDNQPMIDANLDDFKRAVDFFFTSVLNTDLYLKSVPKTSSLCPLYMRQFKFE